MNLRKEVRGMDCLVRIPGVCNFNPETVVLAHLGGAGMGRKHHDLFGAACCSACHDAIDGRKGTRYTRDELKLMHLEGIVRTQQEWINRGLL